VVCFYYESFLFNYFRTFLVLFSFLHIPTILIISLIKMEVMGR
jgi:hypothetical protein